MNNLTQKREMASQLASVSIGALESLMKLVEEHPELGALPALTTHTAYGLLRRAQEEFNNPCRTGAHAVSIPGTFTIQTTSVIPDEQVRNLLVSAFEGGSNYWYNIEDYWYGPYTRKDFLKGGTFYNDEYDGMVRYLLPFVPQCSLLMSAPDDDNGDKRSPYTLDRVALEKGLILMQDPKWHRHWDNFISENDDAETADVYLQLCLLGDVVYG